MQIEFKLYSSDIKEIIIICLIRVDSRTINFKKVTIIVDLKF
jgi:hypothetical protein